MPLPTPAATTGWSPKFPGARGVDYKPYYSRGKLYARQATSAWLFGLGLLMALACGARAEDRSAAKLILRDYEPFTLGSYFAFLAPFNAGRLVAGKDYIDQLSLNPARFPGDVAISWRWPNTPCPTGVCNFMSVQFGNYANTHPQQPVPSRKINDIKRLVESHRMAIHGNLQGFDVITDIFLTPMDGGDGPHTFEVEIFLHTPRYSYGWADKMNTVGLYRDGDGQIWKVVFDDKGKDIVAIPSDGADRLSASIDIRALLVWLVQRGIVSGNEYFNGLATGAEARQGSGGLDVSSFSVVYE